METTSAEAGLLVVMATDSVEVDYRTNFNAWYHVVVNTDTRKMVWLARPCTFDDLFFSKVNDLYQGVC